MTHGSPLHMKMKTSAVNRLLPINDAHSRVFKSPRLVRFSDCDPAGMVFYPNYFVMLNALVEDWFTQGLGINHAHLLGVRRIGLPTVALQTEFRAPGRMGDTLEMRLQVTRMGRRSFTLRVACMKGELCCVEILATIVTTSLAHDGAIEIPADVRQAMTDWQSFEGAAQ